MLSGNLKLTVLKGPSNSARKPSKIRTERCEMDLDTKHIHSDITHMDLHTGKHGFVHKHTDLDTKEMSQNGESDVMPIMRMMKFEVLS